MDTPAALPDDLIQHLVAHSRLSPREAEQLVGEVLRYYRESCEDFVCRRHRELQCQGLSNAQIYQRIRGELADWRFPAPVLSERQIRRMIYG